MLPSHRPNQVIVTNVPSKMLEESHITERFASHGALSDIDIVTADSSVVLTFEDPKGVASILKCPRPNWVGHVVEIRKREPPLKSGTIANNNDDSPSSSSSPSKAQAGGGGGGALHPPQKSARRDDDDDDDAPRPPSAASAAADTTVGETDNASARTAAKANWAPAGNMQHTYAVKEFERQVYARLDGDGYERVSEYTVEDTLAMNQARDIFLEKFPQPDTFKWAGGGKLNASNKGGSGTIECDLYIRVPPNTKVSAIFKDCADHVECLTALPESTEWSNVSTTNERRVVLCEVAEKPEHLREKLWQIERAMSFGPDDFKSLAACVICLNGENPKFECAAEAAKKGFASAALQSQLKGVPVFALWTPYRNIYAEVKALHAGLNALDKKMDDNNEALNKKMDENNQALNKKMEALNKKMDENNQALNKKMDEFLEALTKR